MKAVVIKGICYTDEDYHASAERKAIRAISRGDDYIAAGLRRDIHEGTLHVDYGYSDDASFGGLFTWAYSNYTDEGGSAFDSLMREEA